MFARKRNFSLNKTKKLKSVFCGKFGSIPTFRSTRKDKKCFRDVPVSAQVLHNIASSSSFFNFTWICLLFLIVFRISKLLEFKEFNKTIIPSALAGYETGYSQHALME